MKILRGCGTAIVTPFDTGEVQYDKYKSLLERQVGKVDFLVALGTTAETPCLEEDEKLRLLEISQGFSEDLPLVIGCGTNSPKATIRNIQKYDKYNPSAYLVVVPYYNKPTQQGIYQYFKEVADATDKGILIYNVPGRTGANIQAETTIRLAEDISNIIGIKEASGNLDQIKRIIGNVKDNFSVLSGNDDQTLEILKMGGDGVISVVSNLYPEAMGELVRNYFENKDITFCDNLDDKLRKLYDYCFVESNPIPVKAGLEIMGLCSSEMRIPLSRAKQETFELMKEAINEYERVR